MPVSETRPNDEILGYRLEARIGAGGFGEVWKAEAPGGLSKAIKIVFGYHDDSRAQKELKALNTVRDLRHPFLLSLERIDIHKGQLIVVTELADKSLTDQFRECRKRGLSGIPRDELLAYMRDAADGLDYLCNKHLLQHLDVKPENLLLVGDHIKVADYGLVKDVRNVDASIMSGMTPTYAAPELFDGRPSQLSDQYSLAIVYQEMLTGIRPFEGTTAASLARQHLKDRPNLEPLPRGDQAVVARALSKDPTHRFGSCLDFVEELLRRRTTAQKKKSVNSDESYTGHDTTPEATMVLSSAELPTTRSTEVARRLPPMECDGSEAAFHPTLMIGVGRTGALALQDMKQRLHERFGRSDHLAAVQMLCLDTDQKDLYSITGSEEQARFKDEEVLSIALRDSSAYRKSGDAYTRWLSRRWIYNIPRSCSTEGIRPLGRLAFADHYDTILERLHQLVQKLADPASLRESSNAVGLPINATPRIYIVGSISGGVGSGIIADLAYTVRAVLQEHGLSDEWLTGILFHSSGRTSSEGGLAVSNSYACLRELAHYSKLGYPGDETIGLQAFDDECPAAFSDLYLMHCGNDDLTASTESVADYLYLDVATGCNDFFKRCRNGRNAEGKLPIRTLGVSRIDMQQERTRCRFSAFLQKKLFAGWLSSEQDSSSSFDALSVAKVCLDESQVTKETFLRIGRQVAIEIHGRDYAHRLREISEAAVAFDPLSAAIETDLRIREFFQPKQSDENFANPAARSVSDVLFRPTKSIASGLWKKVGQLLDLPDSRLRGAQAVHQLCCQSLEQIRDELDAKLKHIREQIQNVLSIVVNPDDEESQPADPNEIVELRTCEMAASYAQQLTNNIMRSDRELVHELQNVRELLDTAASVAETAMAANTPPRPVGPDYGAIVSGYLNKHASVFVRQLETFIDKSYFTSLGGLRCLADNGAQNAVQLAEAVQAEARRLVAASLQGLNFDAVMDTVEPCESSKMELMKGHLKAALPKLNDCGGAMRLMIAVPPATRAEMISNCAETLFHEAPTVVRCTDGDLAICFEGQNVSVANVGLRLLDERPDASEFIPRIISRSDVEWIPLTGLA